MNLAAVLLLLLLLPGVARLPSCCQHYLSWLLT
jgi:hypothetical protein